MSVSKARKVKRSAILESRLPDPDPVDHVPRFTVARARAVLAAIIGLYTGARHGNSSDGFYLTFIGYPADGDITAFVTDFMVVPESGQQD